MPLAQKLFASKEELEVAYKELKSLNKVAEKFKVSKKLIMNYFKRYGIVHKRLGETRAKVLECFNQGLSLPETAKHLSLDSSTVAAHAKNLNIKFVDRFHKGYIITDSGYKKLLAKDHPFADSKGYVGEHVLVLEKKLGRFLQEGEVSHHLDHNKLNNSEDNLQLMTITEHTSHHAIEGSTGWKYYHNSRGKQQ